MNKVDIDFLKFDDLPSVFNAVLDGRDLNETLKEIFTYVHRYHKVKSIVIENNYIDRDYRNELGNFYSKTFQEQSGYCRRIHFFKDQFSGKDDFIIRLMNDSKLNYLGYLVMRPTGVGKVGRTLINPYKLDNFYYLCRIKREVHLLGRTLEAEGIPFMEQDAMVITCAQASMWMIAKYMHSEHSLPRHMPFDITEKSAGAGYMGRAIPSSGLSISQIIHGFNNMGLFPEYHSKPNENDKENILWEPIESIYPFVESEIPVLISFGNHAAVVVGHKIYSDDNTPDIQRFVNELKNKEKNIQKYKPGYALHAILSSSIFVDAFIIHDDQQGIYRLLPTNEKAFKNLSNKYLDFLPKPIMNEDGPDEYVYRTAENDIDDYVIPLPDKIYILGDEVLDIAKRLYKLLLGVLEGQYKKGYNYAGQLTHSGIIKNNDPLIFRTYFIRSTKFKSIITTSGMNELVIDYYKKMHMPRFIWVVEMSHYSLYSNEKKILGEILIDSTANKYNMSRSFLSVHLPGYFYKNDNIIVYSNEKPDKDIPKESPYKILWRVC